MQKETWNSCQINIKSAEPQIGRNRVKKKFIKAFVFTHKTFALPRYTWQMLAKIWVLNWQKKLWVKAQFLKGVQNFYIRMQNWWWKLNEVVGKTILNTKVLKYNNVLVLPFFMYLEIQQNSFFIVWINLYVKWRWKKRTSIDAVCERGFMEISTIRVAFITPQESRHTDWFDL